MPVVNTEVVESYF